jgi:hypothetical protein
MEEGWKEACYPVVTLPVATAAELPQLQPR